MRRLSARWRFKVGPRRPPFRQRPLPFLERAERLDRRIKRTIVVVTLVVLAGTLLGTATGRYAIGWVNWQARLGVRKAFGIEPERAEVDAFWRHQRRRAIAQTRVMLENYYLKAPPEVRHLFDVAAMSPPTGLIGGGRGDDTFLVSAKVFEAISRPVFPPASNSKLGLAPPVTPAAGRSACSPTNLTSANAGRIGAIVDEHSALLGAGCRGGS